jgi:phage-related minor tail protein
MLGQLFPSLFGFTGYGADTFSAANTIMPGFGYTLAKGGAFGVQGMVEGYAKGGTFTNSVVGQPTMFRFAKGGLPGAGLGLMGEAGDEAIMPLTRNRNGDLAVHATGGGTQGNVEVVINNYSSEQATAKETTDGKGNRRIEVEIGRLVADQMTTNNSSIQQAMMGSFGSKPRMVRR